MHGSGNEASSVFPPSLSGMRLAPPPSQSGNEASSVFPSQVILATGISFGAMLNQRYGLPIINSPETGGIQPGEWCVCARVRWSTAKQVLHVYS